MTDAFHDTHDGRHGDSCPSCDRVLRLQVYQQAAEILSSAATVQQAADALGVSRSAAESLQRRMRRAGWDIPRKRGGRPRKHTP